ncbi:MAG TPA: MASE3 domain-containing protein [Rhodocyclaceae bacterium]|nr:MASE3 domain-containing protein [Rhodocyclaceae bacterium]
MRTLSRIPPHAALATVTITALLPFLLTEAFPDQLYHVMNTAQYLVFHNIAEFFSVMVSWSIFGVGWYTYDQSKDRHALFLSTAFLAIGMLDFMHTLSYAGMPAFVSTNTGNKAAQFWIAARLLSSSAFLASAYIYPDSRNPWLAKAPLMAAAIALPALVFVGVIYFPAHVPLTFVEGVGLTPFKKISEYVIMLLLFLAALAYWRRMLQTGNQMLAYYAVAFVICIFSETVFAIYKSVYDTYNGLGHVYKVVAFFVIYKSIFSASVRQPYLALSGANVRILAEIANQKLAEHALRESEDKFRYLFERSPIGKSITSPNGAIDVNRAFCEMLGYSAAELKNLRWQDITHPDDVIPTQQALDQLISGEKESTRFVKRYLRKNGSVVWVDLSTSLRRDEAGTPLYFLTNVSDISDRKRAEEEIRALNAELEQRVADRTAKLEAANKELEAFSYSVSHDLRAPLRAIDGFSRKVVDGYGDKLDDEGRRQLQVVRDNAQRMGRLIDDLLAFSRMGRREIAEQLVDMEAMARSVVEELRAAEPQRDIQFSFTPMPPIRGDAAMLRQVWQNLLSNAVKFTRRRQVAHIEISGYAQDEEARYRVKDDGAGFDMRYADKLFGVFQRLHGQDEFEGTGVGLAIVQRILLRHNGRIWGESKPDAGATFTFTLPLPSDPLSGEQAS